MLQDNGLNFMLRAALYMLIILFMSPSDRYIILENHETKKLTRINRIAWGLI